jgi:outer membrane protein assembly factor BamB
MNSCSHAGWSPGAGWWKHARTFRSAVFQLWLAGLLFLAPAVPAQTPPLAATNLWKFSLIPRFPFNPYNKGSSTPAIAPDGTVYQATFDGTLFALTPAGQEKWHFKAGREIKSSPAIGPDGTIYFGSRDRFFYAVTPAGKLKWRFATGDWVDSSPAIAADGTVCFGSWDKNFYALTPAGALKWKRPVGAIVDSSPAIAADGTIYFGAHDRKFYALTPAGQVRWTFATGGEITSSPALGRTGTIYFSSLDGNLYALNPAGTKAWQYHTGGALESSPVLDEKETIYLPVNNYTLAVSPAGQRLGFWPSAIPFEVPPAIVSGRVYVSRPWRTLDGITEDFQLVWVADQLGGNLTAPPMVDGQGIIYACAEDGFLYAFRPPGAPLPPAKSSWPLFRANARHTGRVGDN